MARLLVLGLFYDTLDLYVIYTVCTVEYPQDLWKDSENLISWKAQCDCSK